MKKSYIINSIAVLALASSLAYADTNNSLVQLDLKRGSTNSVDVTLVTSENYGDNVLVRKKSDNKYVILVPQVRSAGYKASNLGGLKDLVSDVDVKTVDDTSGGYTKVTLITTRPLDIKTRTIKSRPVTSDQQEYSTLIAQANAVKNTISTQQPPKIREQKTEITVDKAPKKEVSQQKTVTKQENKITENKSDKKLSKIVPEDTEKQVRRANLAELIKEAKQEKALEELPSPMPTETVTNSKSEQTKELAAESSALSKFKHKVKDITSGISHKIPSKLPKAVGLSVIGLIILSALARFFKKSNNQATAYQQTNDNIVKAEPIIAEEKDFSDITDNENLSWKEKYQMYIDKSAIPVERANNKGHYSFIRKPFSKAIEAKRKELEKLVAEEPEFIDIYDDTETPKIYSEDSSISKTIKFKAFENNLNSLAMSKRNKSTSRFKKYETEIPLHEQDTIKLDDSPLNVNKRNLKNANLQVSDVDKRHIKYQPKEYIMSSVDEYLNIVDSERLQEIQLLEDVTTNPIAKEKENTYLKGSVVKSGFKISPDKGFYLINKDGRNSLIGKVNDKITVIKNFDTNVTTPIQVRHDNANVYMVKAGGFKSLVEVNDDKMGVLIEL